MAGLDDFNDAFDESIRHNTGDGSFRMDDARVTMAGHLDSTKMSNADALGVILGDAEPDGKGGIDRSLPISHPEYNWMFASDVNISSVAFKESVDAVPEELEAPGLDVRASYKQYLYRIGFTPRPYAVITNESVTRKTLSWYEDDGTAKSTMAAGIPKEYLRFTDYETKPAAEYLTAKQGQFTFLRSDSAEPHGNDVPGLLRILQNKSAIKFRWFQVPLSFVESEDSYLEAGLGHINQHDWYGWKAGHLLYLAMEYKRYTPPNPGFEEWDPGVVATRKLVDVEMTFLRFSPKTPTGGAAPSAPTNQNHIAAGWNLQPWIVGGNNGYYYATNKSPLDPDPLYKSFPFDLLFVDPDVSI